MIATILMVAITVVLAALVYVLVAGLTPQQPRPIVALLAPEPRTASEWRVGVSTQGAEDLAKFQVALRNLTSDTSEPTPCPQTDLKDGELCTAGGVRLSLDDAIGAGRLQGGDAFVLAGVAPGTSYELVLVWRADSSTYPGKTISGT